MSEFQQGPPAPPTEEQEPNLGTSPAFEEGQAPEGLDPGMASAATVEPPPPAPDPSQVTDPLDELQDYMDPDLLARLRKESSGVMTIPQIISMAGLAWANPEMAQQVIRLKHLTTENAKKTLSSLQSQSMATRRAREAQDEYTKRLETQVKGQETRALMSQYGQTLRQSQKGLGGLSAEDSATLPPVPPMMIPSAVAEGEEEVNVAGIENYLNQVAPFQERAKRQESAAKVLGEAFDDARLMANEGQLPSDPQGMEDWFVARVGRTGYFSDEEARSVARASGELRTLSELNRNRATLNVDRLEKTINNLEKRGALYDAQIDVAYRGIERGGIKESKAAAEFFTDVSGYLDSLRGQFDQVNERIAGLIGSGLSLDRFGMQERAELESMRAGLWNQIQSMEPKVNRLANMVAANADKITFASTYDRIFQSTREDIIRGNPQLMAAPETFIMRISTQGPDPVKEAFWEQLVAKIRAKYGQDEISFEDIFEAMESEAFTRLQERGLTEPAPGLGGPGGSFLPPSSAEGVLTEAEQFKFGMAGEEAAAADKQDLRSGGRTVEVPSGGLIPRLMFHLKKRGLYPWGDVSLGNPLETPAPPAGGEEP